MVTIKWCFNVKNGLELITPNENMSISYLKMAEESMVMIKKNEESRIWSTSTSYYTMYYCLYSLMMKLGIKCEIHQCSIEFMKHFLNDFYSGEEIDLIKTAFEIRNSLQYYPDKLIDESKIELIKKGSVDFFVKTKTILAMINEKRSKEVRKLISEGINELKKQKERNKKIKNVKKEKFAVESSVLSEDHTEH